jgi:hypothetical protein
MPRNAKEHPEKSGEPTLLEEFENSLPDFKNLDQEQHLEFVKAIRLLCRYFDISEGQLRREHFFKLRSTIARLNQLYEEYLAKEATFVSAILMVKLHIESHYLDDQDAKLVHNLTSLHVYPPIPGCVPDGSDGGTATSSTSDRIRESIRRLVDRVLGLVDQARVDSGKVFTREL